MTKLLKNLLIVVVLCVCVGIQFFVTKNDYRWDATEYKQHTLTSYTQDLIDDLDEEIRVTVFYVGLPPKYLEDLLNEYSRQSNKMITFEIIDPIVQIGAAAEFDTVVSSKSKKIIVEQGTQREDVDFTKKELNEETINNAILRVTREVRHAYFLTGHGEFNISEEKDNGLSTFAQLLLDNNIIPKKLMLGITDNIPGDCDVLIIAGAKKDLSSDEVDIIEEYLAQGGDALFLIEHVIVSTNDKPLTKAEEEQNPSLNVILNNWGLRVNKDVVVDTLSHASGDVGSPATRNYMAATAIVEGLDYTFYIRPRSISIVEDRRSTLKIAPFILTASSKESWGETDRYLDIKFNAGVDKAGPVPIGYVAFEPQKVGESAGTRLITITDADFLTNIYIDSYSNAQMGVSVLNWLTDRDYEVLVDKKDIKITELSLTSQQKRQVVIILLMIPFVVFLLGLFVWLKR